MQAEYNKLQEIVKELGALETIKYVMSLKYQRQCLVRDSSDPQAELLGQLNNQLMMKCTQSCQSGLILH